jgi:hypothetical protein
MPAPTKLLANVWSGEQPRGHTLLPGELPKPFLLLMNISFLDQL